jgi:hypothetical protein
MKQTAVEWLITQLPMGVKNAIADKIEQAKQMEEKQHSNTFLAGGRSAFNAAKGRDFTTFEDYYNETYGKE